MNAVERLVYRLVRDNEPLKKRLRDVYQRLCDLRPLPDVEAKLPFTARDGFFFGFHDKCPFSAGDRHLLGHRELIPLRMPRPDDAVEVGLFGGDGWRDFRPVATTTAWTWHQGAMLQWIGERDHLAFNDAENGRHVTRIHDAGGARLDTLPRPIAAVSPDGRWAAGYSFVRAGHGMPGYGYANGDPGEAREAAPPGDGLWTVELASGTWRLAVRLAELVRLRPLPSMDGAFHWVTHCIFSPGSRRVLFMHRWVHLASHERWTRLLSCEPDGSGLHLFPTDRMVSHIAWRDDEWVLAYARTARFDNAYHLFHDRTDEYARLTSMDSDGHPSYDRSGRWVVTDTYPDAFRRQTLIVFDALERARYDVARFRVPRRFFGGSLEEHWMVDLHPRWSRSGRTICFDSAQGDGGHRSLCTMDLGELSAGLDRTALHVRRE